jgi:hypothetical protein
MADGMDTSAFDKAFEDLAKMGDAADNVGMTPPAEGQNAAPETPAEPPAAETPATEAPAAEAPAAGEPANADASADNADAGEPPPAAETEGKAPKPDEDVLKRFADMMERQEQERAAQQQQPQQPQQPQEEAPQLISGEELQQLQVFEKDWPDVAQAMRVVTRANNQLVMNAVFEQLNQYLGPKIQMLDLMANRMHYRELQEEIPQYDDDYRERVKEWALSDAHPTYLRQAHAYVIEHGSMDDAKALIAAYEQAQGGGAPAPTPQPAQRQKSTELPPAAIQAAKSMAPVSGKRSNPSAQLDPQSFDDAFDRFAKEA